MGNKKKLSRKTKSHSYKENAKLMNDVIRKKKLQNSNESEVSHIVKRPRLGDKNEINSSKDDYHELTTVEPLGIRGENTSTNKNDETSKHTIEVEIVPENETVQASLEKEDTGYDIEKESRTDVQFHLAALRGDRDRLRQLLDTGKVHIDSRDRDGTTPLILSAAMGHAECVAELLAQGADPACCRTTGTSALFFAAQGGFLDIARLLLDAGAAIDAPSLDGGTPLFVACQCGHLPVVEELIKRGADVNSCMKDRATPLFIAAQNGHASVCVALLRAGARPDRARADRATPLWIAAQCGHAAAARALLAAGAAVDAVRQDGATPLFKAAHKGHTAVVAELLPYKPNLGILPNGQTSLHGAAMFGQLECVRQLARLTGPHVKNAAGLTPAQVATAARHGAVAAYLQQLPRA